MIVSLYRDTSLCFVLCWDHIGQLDKDDYNMMDEMMDGMMDGMMERMMDGMIGWNDTKNDGWYDG